MRQAMICGAGIAGLTLAWWLHRDGWQVELVERASGPRSEGYMIDFGGSGYDVAERMDLIPYLREISTGNTTVSYVDSAGHGAGRLEYQQLVAAIDGRALTFMRGELERILHDALDPAVNIRYDSTITAVTERAGGAEVTLSDDSTHQVDLLIGADGIHSVVRKFIFGPEHQFLRYLGYHTAAYLLDDDELRRKAGKRYLIVAAPGKQFAIYATNDGRLAAWTVHRAADPRLPDDPQATLQETYADLGPLVRQALKHCPSGRDVYYDQVAQIEMPAWSRGPVTLIGDASQAVSLMAGQGASLAMGSAWMLAKQLRTRGSTQDALRHYEQTMRPFVAQTQKTGRQTARWLVPNTEFGIALRRLVFGAMRAPGATTLFAPTLRRMLASVVPR